MLTTAGILGLGEIGLGAAAGFSAPVVVGLLILPILGFAMTMTAAMANTLVQMSTPNELRGRVLSVYFTIFTGALPFGSLLAGATANEFGTPSSIAFCGLITLLAVVAVAAYSGYLHIPLSRVPSSRRGEQTATLPMKSTGED
jgi:MFS family permease